jgi:prepilin-type N-terminal cleavage/methylation domain-containing protein
MRKHGFTLIEIVVAMAIVGFVATILVPNLLAPTAAKERKNFVAAVNGLLYIGWQQALITHKIHIATFDLNKKKLYLEVVQSMDNPSNPKRVPVHINYQATSIDWPEQFEIQNFYIEGYDEKARSARQNVFFFYIMPDGMAQDVVINLYDTKDVLPDKSPRPVGLILNPFSVQLKEYDTFQKP